MASAMLDAHPAPSSPHHAPPEARPARDALSHLDWLEAEAIHVLREVAGQCARPALLFSGGKDSVCLLRLAEKAFRPGRFPFPLLHVDTGHNYPEVIDFRDRRAAELGERLVVRSVEDSMRAGKVVLRHPLEARNKHQSVTLLDAITELELDVWQYIARERLALPSIYFAHRRAVVRRGGALVPVTPVTPPRPGEVVEEVSVRFRTV